jgi:nucleoside-diphosphate-sugar epimerase
MKVVVTGGAGFLGRRLALRLLDRGSLMGQSNAQEPIDSLVLLDVVAAPGPPDGLEGRAEFVVGDVADPELLCTLVDRDDISVFHLASMVSAGCELDLDGALRVNIDGARAVLDACRATCAQPRLVFTSSIAAFGGLGVSGVAGDMTKLTPETTYGATKAICELLVNDYTRKGFVDGRSARLPTVVIRPGRPNAAASSWVSGVFREPLNGNECVLPVDPRTRVPISGYRTIVDNLIRLHEVDGATLGADRALNLPALDVSAQEMIEELRQASDRPLGPIHVRLDPVIEAIYRGWAQRSSFERATAIGLARDESVEAIIRSYVADFLEHLP